MGYAEAQVVPLRAIRPAGRALRTATADLARAYAKVFASDGKSEPAARAVTAAQADPLRPYYRLTFVEHVEGLTVFLLVRT